MERLGQWRRRFTRCSNVIRDLELVERGLSENRYSGSRGYYESALILAKMILNMAGISPYGKKYAEGSAWLLNSADVFEKYVRSIIHDSYEAKGYVVEKGTADPITLYQDGSYRIEADVLISRQGKRLFIADAKYKEVRSSDHYQMLIYLSRYDVKSGALVYPIAPGSAVETYEHATFDNRYVYEIGLPVDDRKVITEILGQLVERYAL